MKSLKHFLFVTLTLLFIGCGSSSDGDLSSPPSSSAPEPASTAKYITGTAATGAAIEEGMVTITGDNGNKFSGHTNNMGFFKIRVSDLTPPFLLKAEGTSSKKNVILYSTVNTPGTANITPVTNMIMAMAIGENPVSYYDLNPNGSTPDNDNIISAKERLKEIFTLLNLDIDDDFDLIQSEFTADNQNDFDSVLDEIEISYSNKIATIKNRFTQETLYAISLETGENVTKPTLEKELENIFIQIKELIDTQASEEELNTLTSSLMDDDFLDNGYRTDETIANWTTDSNYPVKDVIYTDFSLYRNMKIQQIGNAEFSEYGDNLEGFWCIITYKKGRTTDSFLTSFVRKNEDAPLKWYGNRCPFSNGGKANVQAFNFIDTDNSSSIYSGLAFWTYDTDNLALDNFTINKALVLNSAMPAITIDKISSDPLNALIMTKEANDNQRYKISNVPGQNLWNHMYMQEDGLDISTFDSLEFVFAGLDDNDNIKHVWIDLIPAVPANSSELTGVNFATVTAPATHNLNDLTTPGDITVLWNNPAGAYTDLIKASWNNNSENINNPGFNDSNSSIYTWQTSSFNIDITPTWLDLFVINKDQTEREYYTIWKMK